MLPISTENRSKLLDMASRIAGSLAVNGGSNASLADTAVGLTLRIFQDPRLQIGQDLPTFDPGTDPCAGETA